MIQNRTGRGILVAFAAILLLASVANASVITYTIPTGTQVGGQPVNATVTFTTSLNDIQISLTNLQSNPTSAIQALSDLAFTLDTGQTLGTLLSSSALIRTINSNGTFTDSGTGATGWELETFGSGLRLHVLGTPVGPAHTLIGGPDGGGIYSNGNGSIDGNGAHNPFLAGTATFDLQVLGITDASVIASAIFSFGTTEGSNVTGRVPEPSALLLLGSGLAVLGAAGCRRRRS